MGQSASSTPKSCPRGEQCPVYQRFLNYDFSEEGYEHLSSADHPVRFCRYGRNCRAHQRLLDGGMRLDDRCHGAVYFHPRAEISAENAACLEDSVDGEHHGWDIYGGYSCIPEPDRQLELVIGDLRKNGYEQVLTTRDGRSLVDVARDLRGKARYLEIVEKNKDIHSSFGGPPTDAELLMTLIYTGTDAQGDMRKWLRTNIQQEPGKWTNAVFAFRCAVWKLQEAPPEMGFHGLNGVVAFREENFHYYNVLSMSMDYEIAKVFARGEGGTVETASEVATVLCIETKDLMEDWLFADMRWLSKFPGEKEWVMVPLYRRDGFKFSELPGDGNVCRWLVTPGR